ncbi:MAG: SIS domain-containing protein [Anaerolineales bacterium]|nr:SIS domain-containing protein [Anaerolineales bacterium]
MTKNVQNISTYFAEIQQVVAQLPVNSINQIVDILLESAFEGRKVFIFGNGGSASTASHFACDLSKNTMVDGAPRFRVIALNDNIPLITAWANDTAYDNIFAAQLSALIEPGDVTIGISCSGNSGNVLNAIEIAHEYDAITIAFTGDKGGRLKDMVDICVAVPTTRIEQQEDIHLMLEHCICANIRERLLQKYAPKLTWEPATKPSVSVNS